MAFIDWCPDLSVVPAIKKWDSLAVVHSLTKFFALAGIRSGFVLGDKNFIDDLKNIQETWGCNVIAQKLSIAALQDSEFSKTTRDWFNSESTFFFDELSKISALTVYPSLANFFLLKLKDSSIKEKFWKTMAKKGIYLRTMNDFIGLDNSYFRMALKKREDNLFLLDQIKCFQ